MTAALPRCDGSDFANRRIEVVTTETGDLIETGFGSIATCRGIADVLMPTHPLAHFTVAKSIQDLRSIVARAPDLVVLCVKYIVDNEDGKIIWLSDYFEKCGVAHTGSSFATLDFDSNKSRAKTLLRNKGIRTPDYFLAQPGAYQLQAQLPLPLPLFVKPLNAANGNGIDASSMVRDFQGYETKVAAVAEEFGTVAPVEQVLSGREFTVAVLDGGANTVRSIFPVEIIVPPNCNGDRILGHHAKTENREEICAVEEPLCALVSEFAGRAFSALNARDFGRIDIKLDASGAPHFLEANLVPGMTPNSSYFPLACNINGDMPYWELVVKMVDLALGRSLKVGAS